VRAGETIEKKKKENQFKKAEGYLQSARTLRGKEENKTLKKRRRQAGNKKKSLNRDQSGSLKTPKKKGS